MKTLFLISEALTNFGGISKKILAQVEALRRLGLKVDLSYLKANEKNKIIGRYINNGSIDTYSKISIISEFQWRCLYGNLYNYIKEKGIQIVFVRYTHFANPFFISFLKKLKKNHIRILLEIPTYPYDQEYKNLKFSSKMILMVEKLSRQSFKKYVTRIITITPFSEIFGIPAIEISNGVDAASIAMIKQRPKDDEIHMIGVASISYWHGFDRVIEGLNNYYKHHSNHKKVFFHVIGDAANVEGLQYKALVKKYDLSKYVIFHGRKTGEELDMLFDQADLGVGSLACHRISISDVKSLKNREYCARGIPFFYSEKDVDFEDVDFIFKVPANDTPIDIDEIVNFVDHYKFDPVAIRNFAIQNLSWDKQFRKVLRNLFPGFKKIGEEEIEYKMKE